MAKFKKSSITPKVAALLKGTNVEKYVYDNLDEGESNDKTTTDKTDKSSDAEDNDITESKESEKASQDVDKEESEDNAGDNPADDPKSSNVDFTKMKKAELLELVGHNEDTDGKITVKELIVLAEKK